MGGTVYAVAGGKGGVGKTTTAINLGVVLKQAGQDVVVVDADLAMANVGQQLGIDHEPGIHEVLAGDATVRDAVVTGPAGLRVITGDRALDSFAAAEPTELDGVLDLLAVAYDVVLVDTAAGVQRNSIVTYREADGVVLVTTADDVAIADANRTATMAADADCPTVGAAVTKDESGTAPDAVAGLDADVLAVVPAHRTGGPVTASEPNSDAAGAYRTLAASLPAVDAQGVIPEDSTPETEESDDRGTEDGVEREETASP
ncbi:MinD/ParA family ATP-binding protein [Halorientalis brevis]|uniref:MinD/ParA family ATP-binding protein n=1 Tax=Halorientalis brevis TaxID=1126241 RepID=UPI001FF9CDAC|nr:P-loop NTPase [Halorientalis brevis]